MNQNRRLQDEVLLKGTDLETAISKRAEVEGQLADLKESVKIKISAADDL